MPPLSEDSPVQAGEAWVQTSPLPVVPFAYYRIGFDSCAHRGGMWGAIFFDKEGTQLDADHYCGFDASKELIEQEFCFRAKANAAEVKFRFHPASAGLTMQDIAVEEVSREEVAEWADAVWAAMPPLDYEPPADRWSRLPRFAPLLQSRITHHASRIVMLGDSIVNDTGNSPWDVLVERQHPGLHLEVVTSVRGGTGCCYYKDERRVKPYVLDFAPDLLMIGGISHNDDTESIRSVIRQVRGGTGLQPVSHGQDARATSPDILLMTGAFGKGSDPRDRMDWMPNVVPGKANYRSRLMALAAEEGCEFLDLEGAWGAYLLGIDQPYAWFMRDEVHANVRGHQLLARILERYFAPKS